MFKLILLIFLMFILSCQQEYIVVKHCIPEGYEGPIFEIAKGGIEKDDMMRNDTIFLEYDSKGFNYKPYNLNFFPKKKMKEIFVYVNNGKDSRIIVNHKLVTYGVLDIDFGYRVNMVWEKNFDKNFSQKIDSTLKKLNIDIDKRKNNI